MASFCPGTPVLHVSFMCVKYEPSWFWGTHRKAFLSWELLFTWGMNWNSCWRVEGLSFGGNLKESPTHYEKREKKCSELRLWDQALWCLAFNPQTPVWTSSHACGNAYATSWSLRGGWQSLSLYHLCLWLGLSFRVCLHTGKGMGVRAWKPGSLIVSHLLGYFPAQSFLFLRALFFKVMMFPKAMNLRTQYVTHRRAVSLMLYAVRVRPKRISTPELKSCQ